jgi:hypothetical protein
MLRATKCFVVCGANVHTVEFGSTHNLAIYCSKYVRKKYM